MPSTPYTTDPDGADRLPIMNEEPVDDEDGGIR